MVGTLIDLGRIESLDTDLNILAGTHKDQAKLTH